MASTRRGQTSKGAQGGSTRRGKHTRVANTESGLAHEEEEEDDDFDDGYDDEILGDEDFARHQTRGAAKPIPTDQSSAGELDEDGAKRKCNDGGNEEVGESGMMTASAVAEDPNSEEALLRRVAELLQDQKSTN